MFEWLGDWADLVLNWVVVGVFFAMAGWETLRPAGTPKIGTAARWLTNVCLYGFGSLLPLVFVPAALAELAAGWLGLNFRPIGMIGGVAGDIGVLAAGLLVLDLYMYLLHRVEHAVFVLWRFHAVHHADIDLDASTGLRHHPGEVLLSSIAGAVVFVVLGIPGWVASIYALIAIAGSLFQHANVVLPARVDRVVRWVLVTPDMHRIHHSIAPADHQTNFGAVLSLWDRVLGTYRAEPATGRENLAFGVAPFTEKRYARFHWALILPFALKRPVPDAPPRLLERGAS